MDAVRQALREAAAKGTSSARCALAADLAERGGYFRTCTPPIYPDPDLLDPRALGEQRLSGFMTWQSAYSEFYFCRALWPALMALRTVPARFGSCEAS